MAIDAPPPTPAPTPAGFGQRFLAYLLDGLILVTLVFPLGLLFDEGSAGLVISGIAIQLYYYTLGHSSEWQATPGKHIMQIYVTDLAGNRLGKRQALERALAQMLPSLPLLSSLNEETAKMLVIWASMVWFMPIFFTTLRTGVHDILCQTRVVTGQPIP